jgi:acyl carrier protein
MPRAKLGTDLPLIHYGMDSMMAVELQLALHTQLGVEFSAMELRSITLGQMTARVLQSI